MTKRRRWCVLLSISLPGTWTDFFSQLDSEDEREEAALKSAQESRMISQMTQKNMKNHSRLPRTAGLRTLSELTGSLTKAGLDPSRIQERAEMLAKIQGEARRKRKREEQEEGEGMEVDGGDGGEDGEGEWMDVDDEDGSPGKRAKANSGAVVAKNARRLPKTNRQAAGMRDEEVRIAVFFSSFIIH